MNCGKCGEKLPYKASSLQQELPDGVYQITVSGDAVKICSKCYDEYCGITLACEQEVKRRLKMWLGGSVFETEYDEQRHRILSLSSGSMFNLISQMAGVASLEGVVGIKQKMIELRDEIKEALD